MKAGIRPLPALVLFFAALYASISFANHYFFRTYALDLGFYTNALFKYSRFELADCSMIMESPQAMFGGHFDLYLVLFSPLVHLFGTYTLLLVQLFFVVLGGIGVFKYFARKAAGGSLKTAYAASFYFYAFYGVFSALAFDYHSVVVAASLVPWFFYYFSDEKYLHAGAVFLLVLLAQENTSLYAAFICLGLLIEYRKNRRARTLLLLYLFSALLYFVFITNWVIPLFSNTGNYSGFRYSVLGQNPWDALVNLFQNPVDSFKAFFTNHTESLYGNYVKLETHLMLLGSGVFMLLYKPRFLVMLLPVYGQKFFHDDATMWSIACHYSIEFTPILAIGIFTAVHEFKLELMKNMAIILVLSGEVLATFRITSNTIQYTDKTAVQFYKKPHYSKQYDVDRVHRSLQEIPDKAKVSAQSPFVPHLSLREHIYQFPIIGDAEYIVLSIQENYYPLDEQQFKQKIGELLASGSWSRTNDKDLVILRRKEP